MEYTRKLEFKLAKEEAELAAKEDLEREKAEMVTNTKEEEHVVEQARENLTDNLE